MAMGLSVKGETKTRRGVSLPAGCRLLKGLSLGVSPGGRPRRGCGPGTTGVQARGQVGANE